VIAIKMQIFADLHIHSKYSRATSKNLNLAALAGGAKIKGIDILGTGDFTHPLWMKELKSKLEETAEGIYEYGRTKFVLSSEISLMYKQGGKGRRVHFVLLAPSFEIADQINEFLDTKGRRDYDGRPIFGFSSIEIVDAMMNISKDIEMIPAHAWTPYFSVFGSKSGFDSLKECFQEKAKYIHAIETGLSSDPEMNRRLSQLDNITLVSNSDAHSASPWRLGREANVFDLKKDFNFKDFIRVIRTRKNFLFTIEVSPSYGKYHYDGHRNCGIALHPKETIKLNNLCPKCGKPLTIGVLNRVEQLADRPEGFRPKNAVPFKPLLPLHELIGYTLNQGVATKKVASIYSKLLEKFGSEFNVLLGEGRKEIEKTASSKVADIILSNRAGRLKIEPGYDGLYGRILG
jgi:uncharacterized protein (TIGR00375 family)